MALGKPIRGFEELGSFDPSKIKITLQGVTVFNGMQACDVDLAALSDSMRGTKDVYINATFEGGNYSARAWGCNLSHEYVNINADYTS